MRKHLMAVAALGAVVACSATAMPDAAPTPEPFASAPPVVASNVAPASYSPRYADVSCEVVATRTGSTVRLEAVAHADSPMVGEYSFVIRKVGGSGSADIEQAGPFETDGDESVALGGTELNRDRGRYRALLTISDEDGDEICADEFRS